MPSDDDDDPIDRLRRALSCALCARILRDPTTLPCQHTFCRQCVLARLAGAGARASECPECFAPCAIKELAINLTIASFVHGFETSERAIEDVLQALTRVGREGDDELRDEPCAEQTCVALTAAIRAIDCVMRTIDDRIAHAREEDKSTRDDGAEEAEAEAEARPRNHSLDFESMTLTQLREKYRQLYEERANKTHKKTWYVRHFSSLDRDVLASAFGMTQPTSPATTRTPTEMNANEQSEGNALGKGEEEEEASSRAVVIAYSASTKRGTNSQEAKFMDIEATIKSIDAKAAFLGVKDLTSDVTHLIMETGTSEHVVKNRTAKYIEAIARGIFIVHKDWLDACAERGAFCDEERFELRDASSAETSARGSIDGPRRARLRRMNRDAGLFDGLRIAVRGCGATLSVSALENILRLAGATVVDVNANPAHTARVVVEEDSEHVPDSEDEADADAPGPRQKCPPSSPTTIPSTTTLVDDVGDALEARDHERLVSWRWALECITRYECLDVTPWCFSEGSESKKRRK